MGRAALAESEPDAATARHLTMPAINVAKTQCTAPGYREKGRSQGNFGKRQQR